VASWKFESCSQLRDASVFLYAFDLTELRRRPVRDPLAVRKATLASLLARLADRPMRLPPRTDAHHGRRADYRVRTPSSRDAQMTRVTATPRLRRAPPYGRL